MKTKTSYWLAVPVLIGFAVPFGWVAAQDQRRSVAPDPNHETVELDNDHVRVIRVKLPPHTKSRMHPHPNRVVIPLTLQRSRVTTAEGKIDERSRQPGQVFWGNANSHMTENLSDDPLETLIVEVQDQNRR